MYHGLRRTIKERITGFLSPELRKLKKFNHKEARMCEVCEDICCEHNGEHCRDVGSDVRIAYYWFRRG